MSTACWKHKKAYYNTVRQKHLRSSGRSLEMKLVIERTSSAQSRTISVGPGVYIVVGVSERKRTGNGDGPTDTNFMS